MYLYLDFCLFHPNEARDERSAVASADVAKCESLAVIISHFEEQYAVASNKIGCIVRTKGEDEPFCAEGR